MNKKTKLIVGIGLLTAIVVVLQGFATMIPPIGPFVITLTLTPIIVGSALYGWKAGGWLGFVFGVVVLLTNAQAFLVVNVFGTIVTCLAKGILAGAAAGIVYKALHKKNDYLAVLAAGITAPVVNTGVFLIGCMLFFLQTVQGWGEAAGFSNVGAYFIFGLVGVNFLVEMAVNIVLSSAVVRIIKIAGRSGLVVEE